MTEGRSFLSRTKKLAALAAFLLAAFVLAFWTVHFVDATQERAAESSSSIATSPSMSQAPTPEEVQQREQMERQTQEQRQLEAARLDKSTYDSVTPREFALISKNPDAYTGKKLIVFGVVTQFDAATGAGGFLADAGVGGPCDTLVRLAKNLPDRYPSGTFPDLQAAWEWMLKVAGEYIAAGRTMGAQEFIQSYLGGRVDDATRARIVVDSIRSGLITADELPRDCQTAAFVADNPSILSTVLQKDVVTMWVEVAGAYSYNTQIGGRMTVPLFTVNIICNSPCAAW
jgi:hypothetical protein